MSWASHGLTAASSRSAVEPLVRPREDLLEDVLGVVLGEAKPLHGDRVDVAREALDELRPGRLVAGAAARDELARR